MRFQNPGAEKCQEGVYRELIIFSGLKKKTELFFAKLEKMSFQNPGAEKCQEGV